MKTGVLIGIVVVVLAVVIGGFFVYNSKSSSSVNIDSLVAGNSVEIVNFAFSPVEIKIKSGENVTWTNKDNVRHSVISDSGDELYSDLLSLGESYTHIFNSPGTYMYHCGPHPSMKGKVIVE
jgi:amicyanin